MPNNGAAIACLPLPEPPPTPPTAPDPEIEKKIGEATASAASFLSAAIVAFHETARMMPEIKTVGGARIAVLAQLELDTLGEVEDFAGIARREGLAQLRQTLDRDPEFRRAGGCDSTLLMLIDGVLEISQKVVSVEKVFRSN